MHGAHPGHLAFKLLDRLSLSPCFSPSLLSVPSLIHASLPFAYTFERTCTHRPLTHLSLFHLQMPELSSLFVSRDIVASCSAQFSRPCRLKSHVSLRNTPHLLIFYSTRWHRDKNAHVLPYSSESAVFGERMTSDLLASSRITEVLQILFTSYIWQPHI